MIRIRCYFSYAIKTLIIAVFTISLISCENNEDGSIFSLTDGEITFGTISNPKVDSYIDSLSRNIYTGNVIPAFTPEDIPALMQYARYTQEITNFPRCISYSSYYDENCKLGVYVLWTIESIRVVSIGQDFEYYLPGFPSLHPIIVKEPANTFETTEDAQLTAIRAYSKWWDNAESKGFESVKNNNPLGNTLYSWYNLQE